MYSPCVHQASNTMNPKNKSTKQTSRKPRLVTQNPVPAPKRANVPRPMQPVVPRVGSFTRCLLDPFNSPPCHIPDSASSPSGLLTSRISDTPIGGQSSSSTVHNFGWIMLPYPRNALLGLGELTTGSGTISDLSASGASILDGHNVANINSFDANSCRVRCTGMSARIVYEGTELNRSARIFGGNLPIAQPPFSIASTGTQLSSLSTLINSCSATTTTLRQAMEADLFEVRTPSEKVVEFFWKPALVPTYQIYSGNPLPVVTTGSTNTPVSTTTSFFAGPGQNGVQAGQNALVIVVEGDTTPSATAQANVYQADFVWHWEVVPDNINSVAYDLSPSNCNSAELDQALNTMQHHAPGRLVQGGLSAGGGVGKETGYTTSSSFSRRR
jgi:hypothetical protein